MIGLFFIVICCFQFHPIHAQDDKIYRFRQPVSLRVTYQLMHSTHKDNFNGGSVDINFRMTKHFIMGAGVQYSGTHLHYDNGWVLTNLRLLPVYINTIYTFCSSCRLQPYLHTEEGISINHYNKLDTAFSPTPYKVSEEGLYLSGNMGTNIKVSKHMKAFTEIGYKGFRHSANDLDVNPHGFTARTGIEFHH